jgi:hypothetical protein
MVIQYPWESLEGINRTPLLVAIFFPVRAMCIFVRTNEDNSTEQIRANYVNCGTYSPIQSGR